LHQPGDSRTRCERDPTSYSTTTSTLPARPTPVGPRSAAPEHLVLGLLAQPDELAGRALAELGVTPEAACASLVERLGRTRPRPDGSLGVAPQTKRLLELARAFAKRLGHNCTRTEHILLAAVAPRLHSPAAALLVDCVADAEAVRDQLAAMLLHEAPELANRLHKRWPLATLQIRGIRN
jgi:ATP-dependent Clp protease ATP-binding subunit ClpA